MLKAGENDSETNRVIQLQTDTSEFEAQIEERFLILFLIKCHELF